MTIRANNEKFLWAPVVYEKQSESQAITATNLALSENDPVNMHKNSDSKSALSETIIYYQELFHFLNSQRVAQTKTKILIVPWQKETIFSSLHQISLCITVSLPKITLSPSITSTCATRAHTRRSAPQTKHARISKKKKAWYALSEVSFMH